MTDLLCQHEVQYMLDVPGKHKLFLFEVDYQIGIEDGWLKIGRHSVHHNSDDTITDPHGYGFAEQVWKWNQQGTAWDK